MALSRLIQNFDIKGRLVTVVPTGSGNINDTYLAVFRNSFDEQQVILQRVNSNVFVEPAQIMSNMHHLTNHFHTKLEEEADSGTVDRIWQMPKIVPTKDGKDFYLDDKGNYWRVITKVASATAFDTAQGPEHAMECAAVLGHFHKLVSDMDTMKLHDPLPGFHITPQYLLSYDETLDTPLAKENLEASIEAKRLSIFVEDRRAFVPTLQKALDSGEIMLRVMHGDPKVNNVMIDNFTGKGTAMIDLDTVGAGLIQYDFGDALRSICNIVGEEEMNLNKVIFDMDLFTAFVKGYMSQARDFLTEADKFYLYDAVRLITFELGLRFFQDYLAGNVYFKTRYHEQNLNRARVQFRLCESIESRERMIREVFKTLW